MRVLVLVAVFAMIMSTRIVGADEPRELQQLDITADDDVRLTGLDVDKFRVPTKAHAPIEVVVSEQRSPDAEPRILHRKRLDSERDSTELLLSFLPRDKTLRGVLLSEEEVEYRVECPSCSPTGSPTGFATIIPVPWNDIRSTRKTLVLLDSDRQHRVSRPEEICLIAILVAEEGQAPSLRESFPRAIVSVKGIE